MGPRAARAVLIASAVAAGVVAVTALGGCSSGGSSKDASPKNASSQTSIVGCDVSPDTAPARIIELSIAQAFYDEHLFSDPAPSYKIIAQGKVSDNADFNQWWDKYEGDQHLLLDGKTMADWETDLMQNVFPKKTDVYARYCAGWRFSTYHNVPSSSSTASAGTSPSAT